MSIEIKVPALPESVADAVVASWYKKAGEVIKQDEKLVDLETDKVILEVPATQNGIVKEIKVNEGDTVIADQVIAIIEEADAVESDPASSGATQKNENLPEKNELPPISPSARKMLEENNLDPEQVKGSGKHGRILKEDIEKVISSRQQSPTIPEKTGDSEKTKPAPLSEHQPLPGRIEKRVPMTRLRARIAERLLDAQHNAAILTTFNEVNMKPVMELRKKYKDRFEKEYNVRLGFMSFFVKACVEALKKFPDVNASVDGNEIVYHGYFDIGVAVSGPSGLVVPVLRDADMMSIAEVEKTILNYSEKAKNNSLAMEDITGGTFTISNGGVFGSMMSTPILNPPQSAILGMHAIKERPMVVDGEIVVLPMMYLALSYDHRIIDGSGAVQFLTTIRDLLEDPSRMLLGI